MTIKRRFIISYLSAIILTLSSVFLIFSLIFYITLDDLPSFTTVYKMLTTKRSLTSAEEKSFIALDELVAKSPELLEEPFSTTVRDLFTEIEQENLKVVIRKNQIFPYYSDDLAEKSLNAHIPDYELNNFEPIGTLDNAGRLYHYLKSDFTYLDGSSGSFIILKRESNLLEFFTKWGIWIVFAIISLSLFVAWHINKKLQQTTIIPLEKLSQATKLTADYETLSKHIKNYPEVNVTEDVQALQTNFKAMWLELQRVEHNQRLNEANRQELITNLSHDLKTPMTSIIGYVEGLQDGVANTPEKQAAYLKTIHDKALSLNDLIEELFIYSNLEINAVLFDKKKYQLQSFLNEVTKEYSLNTQIAWSVDLAATPLYAEIDPLQMTRVLTNLIQNSLKFKQLSKPQVTIQLTLAQENNYAVLKLKDDGIGIPESQLAHVLERFYRGDQARSATVKGSGLGLSIVKEIVEAHAGSLGITSQLGVGTTVSIYLPITKGE